MFSKLKTLKTFTKEIVDINELIKLVSSNQQKELIDKIRSVEYKSKEYKDLKLNVNCITPHGTFNSLCNDGLISLSGYLYYDIDGFDTEIELNDTKNRLIDTGIVSFICKSVGGKGLSFLIRYDTNLIDNDTFIDFYKYVRKNLLGLGFNIDLGASGLVRKMIISSDDNFYFNNKVSLGIDIVSFNKFKKEINSFKTIQQHKEEIHIIPNDTFLEIIPYDILLKEINIETIYTKEIDGDFIIEDMDYYKIILPKIIKDGTKHKLYTRIVNALYYINNNITIQQVYSYLFSINNMASPKMNNYKLQTLVINICNNIESTGEIRIKPRVKRLHFNKEIKLTKNQKQNMGAQLSANLKVNKTLEKIEMARIKCQKLNISPTQKTICEMTGLGIATIKRNWNKEYKNINDIKINNNEKQLERDYKLSQLIEIDEDLFFQKEVEIIRYKNFKEVEIEKISQEDKKLFISKINGLKEIGIEPSESIMIELNIFQQEKTWYMYDKWTKNKK
jgi:hypothetical protein